MVMLLLSFCHSSYQFVVCETERFSRLAELPSSCFEVVRREEVLEGFSVAIKKSGLLVEQGE